MAATTTSTDAPRDELHRVRVLFADQLNLARGKYVPASFAQKGAARLCLGAYAVTYAKDLVPAPGAGLLEGLPDIEIVFDPDKLRPGWEKNTQVALGELELHGEPAELGFRCVHGHAFEQVPVFASADDFAARRERGQQMTPDEAREVIDISRAQLEAAGLNVLVESAEGGVHMAASKDQFRAIFLQGHPEYDINSLLKEYKREVYRFLDGALPGPPPFPDHYFPAAAQDAAERFLEQAVAARDAGTPLPTFPEVEISPRLDNTWGDTARAIAVSCWIAVE